LFDLKYLKHEHFFRKSDYGHRAFVTVFVDLKKRHIKEVVDGKQSGILKADLAHIPGRENVKHIALDLCDSYKSFAKDFFPNAQLVADKFHVLRLLNPSIDKYRKEVTGDRRTLPVRRILLANGKRLDPWVRNELHQWLQKYPALNEVYFYKEALHKLYRIKGYQAAKSALINITDSMAESKIPEIKTLRRTLIKWSSEILAYFETPITNATTEGFNNKAKVIKRRAYGYRSFKNYRLRLLTAC
jgi:transposase